jgi:hypothetical protein
LGRAGKQLISIKLERPPLANPGWTIIREQIYHSLIPLHHLNQALCPRDTRRSFLPISGCNPVIRARLRFFDILFQQMSCNLPLVLIDRHDLIYVLSRSESAMRKIGQKGYFWE